jgi:hypothetical protein
MKPLIFVCCTLLSFTTMSASPVDVGAPAPLASALTDAGESLDLATVYADHQGTTSEQAAKILEFLNE